MASSSGSRRAGGRLPPLVHLFALTVLTSGASTADWPQWLGPARNGVSEERGWLKRWPQSGPQQRWKKDIGHGYSGLVVAKGRLLVFHRIGNELVLDSLDALTGERGWRFSYPTDYEDAYGYDNGPRCCPLVTGDRVLVVGPQGIFHMVDLATGKALWRREVKDELRLPPNFFGTGATPIIEGSVIYANLGGTDRGTGQTVALDTGDGRLIWKSPTDGGSYASPTFTKIRGRPHLFIFHRGGLSCFDPRNGAQRWRFPWRSRNYYSVNAATPLAIGNLLFFSATYGTGSVCLRIGESSYSVIWKDDLDKREKTLDIHWAPPLYVDGHVYGFSGRHESTSSLRCVNLGTGELKWRWAASASGLGRGSMIYSDDHFLALGERGDLALLRLTPGGHEEVARVANLLSYPAWTVPTLANGLLYVRDLKRLICLDLRQEGRQSEGADRPGGTVQKSDG